MVRDDSKDKLGYMLGIYQHVENIVIYSEILFSDFDIILASYSVKYSKNSNS